MDAAACRKVLEIEENELPSTGEIFCGIFPSSDWHNGNLVYYIEDSKPVLVVYLF